MTVAFTPHDRPPRLIRRVTHLPDELLAVYDYEQNLLVINGPVFDTLTPAQQRDVERTHEPALAVDRKAA